MKRDWQMFDPIWGSENRWNDNDDNVDTRPLSTFFLVFVWFLILIYTYSQIYLNTIIYKYSTHTYISSEGLPGSHAHKDSASFNNKTAGHYFAYLLKKICV